MPGYLPSSRDAHINAALTDFSIGYGQEMQAQHVAMRGSTVKRVGKQSDYYPVWDKGDYFRSEMDLRSPGAVSKSAGQRLSHTTYFCNTYALSTYLPMQTKENADIDLEAPKVRYLSWQGMLKRDKVWAANCFGTGLWTSNTEQTGVASGPTTNQFLQFDDSSSVPIDVLAGQIEVVRQSIGMKPNKMITSEAVMRYLRHNSQITDRFKYTSGGAVENEEIARLIGLGGPDPEIIVGATMENSAIEEATVSMADVFGKHILLAWIDPTPNTDTPTAVTTFSWSPFDKVTAEAVAIDSWWDQDRKAWKYEGEIAFDAKITANDAGVFLLNAVA